MGDEVVDNVEDVMGDILDLYGFSTEEAPEDDPEGGPALSTSVADLGLTFSLFPKQQLLLSHPDLTNKIDGYVLAHEVLFGGAAGGGKSFSLRIIGIILAMECPGVQIYLFRKTFGELDKNHMQGPMGYRSLLAEAVEKKLVRIDSSKNCIYFKNGPRGTYAGGSIINLCHLQYDKDRLIYQGAEIHVLMLDESTHFSATSYAFLRSRTRVISWKPPEKFKDYFPRILNASNPGGVNHNFWKKMFVDFADKNNLFRVKRAAISDGGMLRQYIPSTVYDNPALLHDDPEYINRLKGLGSPELVRAMLNGDWDIVSGGMFDDVWDSRIHVVVPFKVPRTWYVNRGMDWGSSKPFAVLWYAESDGDPVEVSPNKWVTYPKGTIFMISEWYGNDPSAVDPNTGLKMSNIEIGQGIRERELNNPSLVPVYDRIHQGPADNNIYTVISNESYATAINSGYWGTTAMKDTNIFFAADKSPGSRIKRWGLIRDRLKNSLEAKGGVPMEMPGLFFFNTCNETIRCLPLSPRDVNNIEDLATESEDHIQDALGYRVLQKVIAVNHIPITLG